MNINLHTWFVNRELDYRPKHFIKANTPIQENGINWVKEKLTGRYYIDDEDIFSDNCIYFEDHHEAVFYDLTWS
jgi:hypothetical protein